MDPDTRPTIIAALQTLQVTSIVHGDGYALALTMDGRVFAWGHNRHGLFLLGQPGVVVEVPTEIDFFGSENRLCVGITAAGYNS